ncbi:MAG: L-ribulose-5-phosphate 4-epimerase [Clostridia bacterium]|nr:L-ribulose-5-phosphate 4-epimerase [Clostridia bacterium]
MLEQLKNDVLKANLLLTEYRLVILTWGNVSGIDREKGLVVIKPSGVEYSALKAEDMVVVDLDGNTVEGNLRPSSDTPTHLELYKAFPNIGGVAHAHSTYATAFSQSMKKIIPLGTTHADCFYGAVPVTRKLTEKEIKDEYEKNTGKVIVEAIQEGGIDPLDCPAALVAMHAPFTWGENPKIAVENALVLEKIAEINVISSEIDENSRTIPMIPMDQTLLEKHYFRKHGKNAYYGQ